LKSDPESSDSQFWTVFWRRNGISGVFRENVPVPKRFGMVFEIQVLCHPPSLPATARQVQTRNAELTKRFDLNPLSALKPVVMRKFFCLFFLLIAAETVF